MTRIPSSLARHARVDGWTPVRRRAFLDHLRDGLDVRRAALRVGLSRRSAYHLRQRDEEFARGWDAALREARTAAERRFVALLVERCPWAREVFPDCLGDEGNFFPQDSVTTAPCV